MNFLSIACHSINIQTNPQNGVSVELSAGRERNQSRLSKMLLSTHSAMNTGSSSSTLTKEQAWSKCGSKETAKKSCSEGSIQGWCNAASNRKSATTSLQPTRALCQRKPSESTILAINVSKKNWSDSKTSLDIFLPVESPFYKYLFLLLNLTNPNDIWT